MSPQKAVHDKSKPEVTYNVQVITEPSLMIRHSSSAYQGVDAILDR